MVKYLVVFLLIPLAAWAQSAPTELEQRQAQALATQSARLEAVNSRMLVAEAQLEYLANMLSRLQSSQEATAKWWAEYINGEHNSR